MKLKKIITGIVSAGLLALGGTLATPSVSEAASVAPLGSCKMNFKGNRTNAGATAASYRLNGRYAIKTFAKSGQTAVYYSHNRMSYVIVTPIRGQHAINGKRFKSAIGTTNDYFYFTPKVHGAHPTITTWWKVSSWDGKTLGYEACNARAS